MSPTTCLAIDQLEAFRNGSMSPEKRDDIELHLSECSSCRRQLVDRYRDAHAEQVFIRAPRWLKAKVLRLAGGAPPTAFYPAGLRGRRVVWLSAAAALTVAMTAMVLLWNHGGSRPLPQGEVWRQQAVGAPAPRLLAPAAEAALTGREIEFAWMPVPIASGYSLTLLDERGDILLQRSTIEQRLTIEAMLTGLRPGKPYFWYVTAKFVDGTHQDSEIAKFSWQE